MQNDTKNHTNQVDESKQLISFVLALLCLLSVLALCASTFYTDKKLRKVEDNIISSANEINAISKLIDKFYTSTDLATSALKALQEKYDYENNGSGMRAFKAKVDSLQDADTLRSEPAHLGPDSTKVKEDSTTAKEPETTPPSDKTTAELIEVYKILQAKLIKLGVDNAKIRRNNEELELLIVKLQRESQRNQKQQLALRNLLLLQKQEIQTLKARQDEFEEEPYAEQNKK